MRSVYSNWIGSFADIYQYVLVIGTARFPDPPLGPPLDPCSTSDTADPLLFLMVAD